jgi:hypothetical protein
MCRGFGSTERGILRVLAPAHADGPFVSLATVTTRLYGTALPGQVESVRRSLHRLARLDRVELARGTVEGEGWQPRLVARLVPWGFFQPLGRVADYPADVGRDGAPDVLVQSLTRFGARFAADAPWQAATAGGARVVAPTESLAWGEVVGRP